ncbi:MAG: DUF5686 and carboxypeptidase regulatory-like domain-containing protein [Saprospiraceae bacterium]
MNISAAYLSKLCLQILLFEFLFCFCSGNAQIMGRVTNEQNEPLAYVSVYFEGTSIGTTSNELGYYQLDLLQGEHILVFQLIGFEKQKRKVLSTDKQIDVTLKQLIFDLDEAEFVSSREDPAYSIIRHAIANRKKYEKLDKKYTCLAYTKGVLKILSAPEKLLGKKIGSLDGNIDSTGKGILYLSEAESILQFEDNNNFKETMISSKVAGNDGGFSFNRASSLQFNLYNNTTEFGRSIISPIADYAFSHYKYRLIGTYINEENKQIYKIQLIPKIKADPVWQGFIYIRDSSWTIYEFQAYFLGKQVKQDIFDTVYLDQNQFYFDKADFWCTRNQIFSFGAKLFGFNLEGKFLLNLSNYKLDSSLVLKNKNEVLEILAEANKYNKNYWDSIRPIPLTTEEKINYQVKDSAKNYKDSKAYKDSMDIISNKLSYQNLLLGYSYNRTKERKYITFDTPLNSVSFNPIQGLNAGVIFSYSKYLDSISWTKKLQIKSNLLYGFSDHAFRGFVNANYRYNSFKHSSCSFEIGRMVQEFNPYVQTNRFLNQIYSLFEKKNVLKYFNNDFIKIQYKTDLNYNFRLELDANYSIRSELSNHSNYSLRLKNKDYVSNASTNFRDSFLRIENQNVVQFISGLVITPYAKVWKSPEGIQKLSSVWPVFEIKSLLTYYLDVNKLNLLSNVTILYNCNLKRMGEFEFSMKLSKSFGYTPDIPDAIHPNGNPFTINESESALKFYKLLVYEKIDKDQAIEIHFEHNLQGLLFDRIPIVNKLGLIEYLNYSTFISQDYKPYSEFSIGIGNIGYKIFRYVRLDVIKLLEGEQWGKTYLRVSFNNVFKIGR